ncbi:hypothetical protein CDL15_Pgr012748 [Punica granatum]|uniref:Uncharacterized protein n=1 Tax=Punica granatum TaxID=22663 RepID=A0A218XE89_PUNGR|nr:hypothetical protein CDL15_Pgr012748 [Punica granatum]
MESKRGKLDTKSSNDSLMGSLEVPDTGRSEEALSSVISVTVDGKLTEFTNHRVAEEDRKVVDETGDAAEIQMEERSSQKSFAQGLMH